MHQLTGRRGRRRLAALVAVPLLVGLTGCGSHPDPSDVIPENSGPGAVLVPERTTAKAGETLTFDASGSTLAELQSDSQCPRSISLFVEGVEGVVSRKTNISEPPEETLDTIGTGGPTCKVVNGKLQAKMPAGALGSTVAHKVTVVVDNFYDVLDEKSVTRSVASVTVAVTTPIPGQTTPVVNPGRPTPPTSPATTPPTSDPTPPGHGEDHSGPCGRTVTTGGGTPPEISHVLINPYRPVAGQEAQVVVDASDADPGDGIAGYRYDLDGDGTYETDYDFPRESFTPAKAGEGFICVEARDKTGNRSVTQVVYDARPAGSLASSRLYEVFGAQVGGPTTFNGGPVPDDVDEAFIDFGDGGHDFQDVAGNKAPSFEHTYTDPGRYVVTLVESISGTGDSSQWSIIVDVDAADPPGGPMRLRVNDGTATAAKKQAYTITTLLKQSRDKILKRGKLFFSKGALHSKGTITRADVRGSLPKPLRKVKALKGLKALYRSTFVVKLNGVKIDLGPDTWGVGGTARILAQAKRDRKTRVCLSMISDGRTVAGTQWKVLGATGKAKGLTGGGTYAPIVLGPRLSPEPTGTAIIAKGKAKGIGKCSSLAKYLPGAKSKKKKGRK